MGLLVPYAQQTMADLNFSGRPTGTWGTQLTAHATIHTLGTKQELVAATTHETDLVKIYVYNTRSATTLTDQLVNIYIGGAGVERVLIPNLLSGWANEAANGKPGRRYVFPLHIPRGARITADCQALISADTVIVQIELYGGGGIGWSGGGVECLGADTANSRGTGVVAGSASDGTLTSIGTSTYTYKAIMGVQAGNSDTSMIESFMALDIGLSGAALPGLENFLQILTTQEDTQDLDIFPRYREVPAGTALYARLQSSGTDTETHYVCIYGVY